MDFFNNRQYYGLGAKLLHWGMAAIIIALIVSSKLTAGMPRGDQMHSVHAHFSLAVFALMLLWLLWQIINPRVEFLEDVKATARLFAGLIHFSLFILAVALAAVGVMAAQLDDISVFAFGVKIPKIIGLSQDALLPLPKILDWDIERAAARSFRAIANFHIVGALIALIGLHFLSALFRHFGAGDDTLRRMWFGY